MKKIILLLLLFVAQSIWAQVPTNSENYISTKIYLSADGSKKRETVQYFDGLGRAKELVHVKATTSGKDLVVPIVYDQQGRQTKALLPVPTPTTNSGIHGIDENAVNSYYGVANAFSEQKLENSPLGRVEEVASPGEEWTMASGHTNKIQYLINEEADQVKKYNTSVLWSNATLITNINDVSFYAANQLSKNIVTDENGNITIEFKNSEGKTVLLRNKGNAGNQDTYYVYNKYNQLAFIISPKAEQLITANNNNVTSQILDDLCYRYIYDNKYRLVEKKLPGKGWEFRVYDLQNRLVASQDANMRNNSENPNKWLFTRYDQFGRVVYTGQFTGGTRLQEQNNANAKALNNESRSTTTFTLNGQEIFYTNTAYPSAAFVPYSVNYYDTYPYKGKSFEFFPLNTDVLTFHMTNSTQPFSINGVNSMRNLKTMPTSSYVKNLDDDSWSVSQIWYDALLRPVGSRNINHLGGYTNTEKELDFSGVVIRANTFHKKKSTDTETIIKERFVYDDQYRVKQHYHMVNGNTEELLADYSYNELGQVSAKQVGNGLQNIEYNYNIRGAVTKVNNPSSLNGRLFGYELKFASTSDVSVAPANYNGNITEMIWKSTGDNVLKKYSYRYDQYNRLLGGLYQEPETTIPQNGFYNEIMNYDINGNITSLQRNQKNYNGFSEQIDNLTYNYSGNRLQTITDSSQNYAGYPDLSGNTITYDDNGNMRSHPDKGIIQIDYNILDLPKNFTFNQTYLVRNIFTGEYDTKNITTQYTYKADGTKLKKLYTYGIAKNNAEIYKLTEYIDGFQYETEGAFLVDSVLKFVPTAEGYYNFENNKYVYTYADHLGNIRLSYFKNSNGYAETLEENNYYPFGLKQHISLGSGNPAFNYQYNGKERQPETGWNDYGWRQYMPEIGKWNGMDKFSELYHDSSPYAYVGNNPIRFTDPDGRCISDLAGNFPDETCAAPIQEVIIGAQPKSSTIAASSFISWGSPSFLSGWFGDYFGSGSITGGGSGSGGGGGGGIAFSAITALGDSFNNMLTESFFGLRGAGSWKNYTDNLSRFEDAVKKTGADKIERDFYFMFGGMLAAPFVGGAYLTLGSYGTIGTYAQGVIIRGVTDAALQQGIKGSIDINQTGINAIIGGGSGATAIKIGWANFIANMSNNIYASAKDGKGLNGIYNDRYINGAKVFTGIMGMGFGNYNGLTSGILGGYFGTTLLPGVYFNTTDIIIENKIGK